MADETMTDEQILEGVEHKSFVATSDRTAASLSASGVAAEDVARAAAQAAYDKKGEDVQVLDLTELSDVCDYFVLATGTNNRQVDSIVDEIEEKVAEACGEHRSPSRAVSRRPGCSWTTARLSSTSLPPRPASSTVSRSSGVTLPSFPSTSFSSSFGTGLFSYPLPFAGQLRHSQLPGFLFAIGTNR